RCCRAGSAAIAACSPRWTPAPALRIRGSGTCQFTVPSAKRAHAIAREGGCRGLSVLRARRRALDADLVAVEQVAHRFERARHDDVALRQALKDLEVALTGDADRHRHERRAPLAHGEDA